MISWRRSIALTTAPVLRLPRLDRPFVLTFDASTWAAAGVLYQRDTDGEQALHPIAYTSKKSQYTTPPHQLCHAALARTFFTFIMVRSFVRGSFYIQKKLGHAPRYRQQFGHVGLPTAHLLA